MRRSLQFSAYLLIPALGAATPLIAIPAITAAAGAGGWEAYVLGLSIGAAACTLVELGWPLTGPQRVAAESGGQRWTTLVSSMRTRLLALMVLAPVTVAVAVLLAMSTGSDHAVMAALMAFASATGGMSGNWYFIGVGRPLRILSSDTLPRVALISAASIAVSAGAVAVVLIPVAYIGAVIVSPIASLQLAKHERDTATRFTLMDDLRTIRSQLTALGGRSIAALYIALPVTLVGIFAPAALASFAAAERLMRMALAVLLAVPNVLQNWLGSATNPIERRHRVLRAIALNGLVGLVSGVAFTVATPWISTWLFSGTVQVERGLAALAGGIMVLVCISRATGPLALVRYHRIRAITVSAVVAATVGLPAVCLLSVAAGAAGALVGEMLAEASALGVQVGALIPAMRHDLESPAD